MNKVAFLKTKWKNGDVIKIFVSIERVMRCFIPFIWLSENEYELQNIVHYIYLLIFLCVNADIKEEIKLAISNKQRQYPS